MLRAGEDMKLDQAVRINDHLLDAGAAMEKARMAIAGLGKVERIELGDWLDAMIGVLEDKLLQPIYAARLKVLSDSDRIEGIGDIRSWLHSEVRLKD